MEKTLFTQPSSIGEQMGVDDMQEALDLGFLDVHGKKTDSTSVRMTHEALQAIDALAAMDDIKRSEWIRDAAIEKLMKFKKQHEYLSRAFGNTTNTVNTSSTNKESPVAVTTELDIQNLEGNEQ